MSQKQNAKENNENKDPYGPERQHWYQALRLNGEPADNLVFASIVS